MSPHLTEHQSLPTINFAVPATKLSGTTNFTKVVLYSGLLTVPTAAVCEGIGIVKSIFEDTLSQDSTGLAKAKNASIPTIATTLIFNSFPYTRLEKLFIVLLPMSYSFMMNGMTYLKSYSFYKNMQVLFYTLFLKPERKRSMLDAISVLLPSSISSFRNSFALSNPFTYALKCFFITEKFL